MKYDEKLRQETEEAGGAGGQAAARRMVAKWGLQHALVVSSIATAAQQAAMGCVRQLSAAGIEPTTAIRMAIDGLREGAIAMEEAHAFAVRKVGS